MKNTSNIVCPKCGAEIPLTEAISHQVREELAADFEKQRQKQNEALDQREANLDKLKNQLAEREKTVETQVNSRLESERKKIAIQATQQAEEKLSVELTGLRQQLQENQAKLKKAQNAELDLLKQKQELDEARQKLDLELARQIDAERKKISTQAAQQAEQKLAVEMGNLRQQLDTQQAELKKAQAAELDLLKQKQKLEQAREQMNLELARQLNLEREKIANTVRTQTLEAEKLKLADKDEVIKGLKSQIEALNKRAEQGSMQLQGESLEITLENDLHQAFPFDEITEVKKGERGADVLQKVRTNIGQDCGSVLWEAKRAKNWSVGWIEKLKEDQRDAKADLAVLVTTCPPQGLRGIGLVDGVWVSEPAFACAIAAALRHGLISVSLQRSQEIGRADKMSLLYKYLCGIEFRQEIEGLVESFVSLKDQLAAEQRAFAKQWKEREQQLSKAVQHTAMLYGSIQGIAGRGALPEIQVLQLPGATNLLNAASTQITAET